ncbi:MAG: hypothetical protein ACOX5J_14525 [Candidatus Hydrogenedentales bacterium]|jgi:hypothetical protein
MRLFYRISGRILMVLVILSASGPAFAQDDNALQIATFRADVTPSIGAVLCNGGVEPAQEIVDPLTARGVVLWAADGPIVLCAVDWVGIGNEAHDAWRDALAKAANTTRERVAVHTVHQHDTPGADYTAEHFLAGNGIGGAMFDVEPAVQALNRVAAAVAEAAGRPERVTHLGVGMGRVEKVASNRRILGPDGQCGPMRASSCRNEDLRNAPEGVIDPNLRMLSFWNEDKPVACLSYYATHPQSHYGKGGVSWDFVGIARALRDAALPGTLHVHFNGAGGDIAAGKYNDGSPENRPVLAARLAEGMRLAWESTEKAPITASDLHWRTFPVSLPVSEVYDMMEEGKILADETANTRRRVRAARALAWFYRMSSGHRIELTALDIGPVTVLHMPGELSIGYQLAAQEMGSERFVCLAAYGDYAPGYICLSEAYSQGGYEPSASRVSPEVEGVLMQGMRALLQETASE